MNNVPIQLKLNCKETQYYYVHLSILNAILDAKMTTKEIEFLATFLSLPKELIEEDMFNSVARNKVMKTLNISSAGLSNYLKFLILKKVLDKNAITKKITIKHFLIPSDKEQGYQIKIFKNVV